MQLELGRSFCWLKFSYLFVMWSSNHFHPSFNQYVSGSGTTRQSFGVHAQKRVLTKLIPSCSVPLIKSQPGVYYLLLNSELLSRFCQYILPIIRTQVFKHWMTSHIYSMINFPGHIACLTLPLLYKLSLWFWKCVHYYCCTLRIDDRNGIWNPIVFERDSFVDWKYCMKLDFQFFLLIGFLNVVIVLHYYHCLLTGSFKFVIKTNSPHPY